MDITHTIANGISIITPQNDSLDATDAPHFKAKVLELIRNKDNANVVIDLHNLQFIDSSGIGSFLSILRTVNATKGKLKLAALNKQIRTMFELVSMHKIFEIYLTTEEALLSFSKPASKNT